MNIDFYTKTETDALIAELPSGGGEIADGFFYDTKRLTTNVGFTGADLSSYEIGVCFKATVMPTASRPNVFFGSSSGFYVAPSCEINNNGIWHGFAYSGNSWQYSQLTNYVDTPITFGDFMQWIKIGWNGEKQSLYHSLNGETYTLISEFSTPPTTYTTQNNNLLQFGGINNSGTHTFQTGNDINFLRCYIKYNDVVVWGRA